MSVFTGGDEGKWFALSVFTGSLRCIWWGTAAFTGAIAGKVHSHRFSFDKVQLLVLIHLSFPRSTSSARFPIHALHHQHPHHLTLSQRTRRRRVRKRRQRNRLNERLRAGSIGLHVHNLITRISPILPITTLTSSGTHITQPLLRFNNTNTPPISPTIHSKEISMQQTQITTSSVADAESQFTTRSQLYSLDFFTTRGTGDRGVQVAVCE